MDTYRVIEQYTQAGQQPSEPKVLWEGTSIAALSAKYPRHQHDDLRNFSHSDFTKTVRFEKKAGENWIGCPDPRHQEDFRRRR
jgi:hypothetical protein